MSPTLRPTFTGLEHFAYCALPQLSGEDESSGWVLFNKLDFINYVLELFWAQENTLDGTLLNLLIEIFNQFYSTTWVRFDILLIDFW